jgi:hypothetical protein
LIFSEVRKLNRVKYPLLGLLDERVNLLFGRKGTRRPSRIRKLSAWELVLAISLNGFKKRRIINLNHPNQSVLRFHFAFPFQCFGNGCRTQIKISSRVFL